ncbi:hypothetical protein DN752_08855 [Echinicola strongylocentroti]|uniref:GP-PDE domain-containing protein n=1 Tax=Echinicola strongylocentroti TaxID=1795355 RepID=A0A2Z4IIH1_9BACT|nr:glycerophosphodiester phosphodiesterase family protein [Echinicola strongylocentroti]AWW30223.1 hypothetical protein DN752_08855 [Echinicola strongylocentroti]
MNGNRKLVNWAIGVMAFFTSLNADAQAARDIELVVHRGGNRHAPENTLAAAEAAKKMGADYLEMDVRQSKDGVYYNMHDESVDRTTDGIGKLADLTSGYIEQLDAGSWYRHGFKDEHVPAIEELVGLYKDSRMKLYVDFKAGDIADFVTKAKAWGVTSENSFFYFGDWEMAKEFVALDTGLPLKIKVGKEDDFDSLYQAFHPEIIEVEPANVSKELIDKAHAKGVKVMGWIAQDQRKAYLDLLQYDIDMMNLDNPDVFASLLQNSKALPDPYLIAHRGGVVEELYEEYDPQGLEEAYKRGYGMVEVDVCETLDGVLFVHHDRDFKRVYGVDKEVTEVTWDELKHYRSLRAGFSPMTFDEYAALCEGRFDLMVDVKSVNKTPAYYEKLRAVLEKHGLMENLIFLDREARRYFWGEARFGVRVRELPEIVNRYQRAEDVACHFFLFDHGTELTAQSIRMAQKMYMEVIPSVNIGHYKLEFHKTGAGRDIKYNRSMGVTSFQIDSDYDMFFKESLTL